MQTNYFVCTLGQASTLPSRSKLYRSISEFIDFQAQRHPFLPAVGFPIVTPKSEEWSHKVLTFGQVQQGTRVFAQRLSRAIQDNGDARVVALLCHSSPEFLFIWLSLMRLGYSVLLIAPQCQPEAILHLCASCQASTLFYDEAHTERAQQTETLAKEKKGHGVKVQLLPLTRDEDVFEIITSPVEQDLELPQRNENDVAYLHHTSGTSSGLPKPIPQTHRGALCVLPYLPKIPGIASFTTTPLYHGGIADLFRCWTSNALIWLFPSKDVPITARNICQCLEQARSYSSEEMLPKVKYFSSVPYVLQMMDADENGLDWLREMEIVGVGGAALPAEVGDRLVEKGVNLISRFGSAECGFLLSSYRDFDRDKDWQYLRNYNPSNLLDFEKREDGLAELVIRPGWPHMVRMDSTYDNNSDSSQAKQNREDGSFATADLFAPHPDHKNAWLYHSRADSQLTLITGKKFDPAPLEAAIATSPQLDDVLIFGNGRPFPGALLLRSERYAEITDQELLQVIKPVLEKLNRESQDHARIPLNMLFPLAHQEKPLEKSSKGTIIRRVAESRFEEVINHAYISSGSGSSIEVADDDLIAHLKDMVSELTSQSDEPTEDMDLFSYGVDSIACMQMRTRIRRLIPDYNQDLPMSVIEDCGTIRRLSEFILRKRRGESIVDQEDEEQLMLDLVKEYGTFVQSNTPNQAAADQENNDGEIVVLTGATGALGAHILDLLGKSNKVKTIYCLVRGADQHAATERVSKALQQRNLSDLTHSDTATSKIHIVPAQLNNPHLGLPIDLYTHLATSATSIIHIAWTVNFRLKLRSFVTDNIAGVYNLLTLALAIPRPTPPRFTYCSSTASILNAPPTPSGLLPEQISPHPSSASPLGYSRSKWVAEHICLSAHETTPLAGRIAVVRVGQLSSASATGIWNSKEAWPMMLSTAGVIRCLPDLPGEVLDWLPVDIAARAFLEIGLADRPVHGASAGMSVYHVLNPHTTPSWNTMLQWLRKVEEFEIVRPEEWVRRLEESGAKGHSAMKLLGLWKDAYLKDGRVESKARARFDTRVTMQCIEAVREVGPLDEAYVRRMWAWIKENVE